MWRVKVDRGLSTCQHLHYCQLSNPDSVQISSLQDTGIRATGNRASESAKVNPFCEKQSKGAAASYRQHLFMGYSSFAQDRET